MKTLLNTLALCFLIVAAYLPSTASAHDDKDHIIHLMKGMFETPENPLDVAPVVVRGDNAIAGWVQGEEGGRALLWRQNGEWQIRLCSGDGLKNADMLINVNISAQDAKAMVEELTAAEAAMDPAIVAKFSVFEGTVVMDGAGGQGTHKHGSDTQTQ